MLGYVGPFKGHIEAILRAIIGTSRYIRSAPSVYTPLALIEHGRGGGHLGGHIQAI